MLVLFSFCDYAWLAWLLPFLLGLGLGWLLKGNNKSKIAELESKIEDLSITIGKLEADLETCKKARMEAEGNVSMLKGRLREIEVSNAGPAVHITDKVKTDAVSNEVLSINPIIPNSSLSDDKWSVAIGTDKLQIIEGVGPKMEEVLKANNIMNFSSLANVSNEYLREILNKYGEKYRIIDPNTWPKQAGLANDKKWNELIELQKNLNAGRSDTATVGLSDSKLEKYLIKIGVIRRWSQDDLKAIEGIGPKIEKLLHDGGIKTWRSLADASVDSIQQILNDAGSRYALADPGTWPKQSELAADGKWDELQEYQDFLNAGKVKK